MRTDACNYDGSHVRGCMHGSPVPGPCLHAHGIKSILCRKGIAVFQNCCRLSYARHCHLGFAPRHACMDLQRGKPVSRPKLLIRPPLYKYPLIPLG